MSRIRKDIEELASKNRHAKDYDPEDEHDEDESASGSEEEVTPGGREHYEAVGKSRLRQPEVVRLDPKYSGVPVSRNAFEDDESDNDPFAANDDDDLDDDPFAQVNGTSERERDHENAHHVSSKDQRSTNDDEDASMSGTNESLDDQDELSAEDVEAAIVGDSASSIEDDSEDAEDQAQASGSLQQKRQALKELFSNQAQSQTAGLSQSNDAKKGRAVKRQYQTFDRLLDARIKLQKGLTATTDLLVNHDSLPIDTEAENALRSAQEAALKLFNTMCAFRNSMSESIQVNSAPKKRKRLPQYDSLDDLSSIWQALEDNENESQISRKQVLNKWSNKVKAADPTRNTASKSKLLDSTTHDDRLSAVLDTYVINEQEKHFRNDSTSQIPLPEYDDNLFYQSLLRELIATRAAASSGADISTNILPQRLHPSGNKQNKKNVDTKASKGRKVRYTVHEKLQNFMAAEGDTGRDTAMWTERGKNEFFGSLFGQDRALVEDDEEEVPERDGADNVEGEALRLFRT